MAKKKEQHDFGAETGKILKLMIHSLYANKDIFIRELISNASDALDKRRYESITNESLRSEDAAKITIRTDEKERVLVITDNGIGMNKQDLVDNLGTIASSGTQRFLEQATGDNKKDIQLIGQFGVGFYSAFMVADEVTVISRKAGEEKAWQWHSDAESGYTIEEAKEEVPVGTSITIHLKKDADEFIDKHRIGHVVRTYSDHISYPIELTDSEGKLEILNEGNALWTKAKSEISDEQYKEFYKHVAHAGDDPWMILHNKVEGNLSYTNLLFIPTRKPFDLFHPDRATRVKLYVKRVFISESNNQLVPQYMRFLRGIVDSEDLPLNISRETLQHNNMVHKISGSITKKVLSELKKKSEKEPEEFAKFWNTFGEILKEGLCEGADANRETLLEVCHFKTNKSGDNIINLDKYIENMKDGQSEIYYILGDNMDSVKNSPQLEGFNKRGLEVIFLTDTVDDFWTTVNHEYKGKELISVTRAGLDFETGDDEKKSEDKKTDIDTEKLTSFIKETLGAKVISVVVSKKLEDSPACLTVQEGGMDIRMERFLIAQKQLPAPSPKIFEINVKHPIIKYIAGHVGSDDAKELSELLFDQAAIVEGEPVADPGAFVKRFNKFVSGGLI